MPAYPWIAQQREAAFRKELKNPNVWINVAAMLLSEGTPLQSCESLFNRVMYERAAGETQSLMWMIQSGFYGPYNRGEYPAFIARIRASQATVVQLNTAIETAMSGSDTIMGYTDQGMSTDPNGQHQPQIRVGGNVFNDWGGGVGGHAGAAAWRAKFEASKETPVTVPEPPPLVVPPLPPPAPVDPVAPLIAYLQAIGKWPQSAAIDITVTGPATVKVNGTTVYHIGT